MNLQQMKAKAVSLSKQALPPSEAILPWTQGSNVIVAEYPFGEGVRVKLEIKGLIQFETPDDRMRPLYTGGLDYAGISFSNACYLRAYVDFSKIPGSMLSFGGYNFCPIPRTMADYAINILVGGTATARRGDMPYSQTLCGSAQCPPYIVSGEQRIIITPDSADLNYKGKWNSQIGKALFLPKSGSGIDTYVHFTDSTVPAGMPLRNLAHTWIPGDPTTNLTGSCSNGSLDCLRLIKNTGIMTSNTRVNGMVHPDSVTLYCWETEPVLNNDMVRQGLMAVLDSSGAGIDSTSIYARSERGFFILQDTTVPGSKPFIRILPKKPNADACGYGGAFPEFSERPAGTIVLAWGHSHPGVNRELVCKDTLGEPRTFGGIVITSTLGSGVSRPDWDEQKRRNDPNYQHYVGPVDEWFMQSDGTLLILRPDQLPKAPLNLSSQNFRWRTSRCAWPRRKI